MRAPCHGGQRTAARPARRRRRREINAPTSTWAVRTTAWPMRIGCRSGGRPEPNLPSQPRRRAATCKTSSPASRTSGRPSTRRPAGRSQRRLHQPDDRGRRRRRRSGQCRRCGQTGCAVCRTSAPDDLHEDQAGQHQRRAARSATHLSGDGNLVQASRRGQHGEADEQAEHHLGETAVDRRRGRCRPGRCSSTRKPPSSPWTMTPTSAASPSQPQPARGRVNHSPAGQHDAATADDVAGQPMRVFDQEARTRLVPRDQQQDARGSVGQTGSAMPTRNGGDHRAEEQQRPAVARDGQHGPAVQPARGTGLSAKTDMVRQYDSLNLGDVGSVSDSQMASTTALHPVANAPARRTQCVNAAGAGTPPVAAASAAGNPPSIVRRRRIRRARGRRSGSSRSCRAAAATGRSIPACCCATGLRPAILPQNRLQKKFTTKINCDSPSTMALMRHELVERLQRALRNAYIVESEIAARMAGRCR